MPDYRPGQSVSDVSATGPRRPIRLPVSSRCVSLFDPEYLSLDEVLDALATQQRHFASDGGRAHVVAGLAANRDVTLLAADDSAVFFSVPNDRWEYELEWLPLDSLAVEEVKQLHELVLREEFGIDPGQYSGEPYAVSLPYPPATLRDLGVEDVFEVLDAADRVRFAVDSFTRMDALLFVVNRREPRDVTEQVGDRVFGRGADAVARSLSKVQSVVDEYRDAFSRPVDAYVVLEMLNR